MYRRVTNTIKLYAKQRRLVQMVSEQIRARENNTDMLVGVLSHIVEFRNGESGAHVRHIRIITEMLLHRLLEISSKYSITAEQQDMIPLASALHDIGKIGIDEKVLNKPGKLTPEEFEVMKTHSMLGAKMLHDLDNFAEQPLLQTAYEIARWHHERWDGRGYPDGLKGDEIPISAQLVSLADVYDALTSERCYKKAFSHEKAVQMILNSECGAFNALLSCGYVDAIAAHETGILQYMKDNSVEFRILEEPLLVTGLGIAFAKNDSRGLDTQLNAVLAQMRTDGTLEQILGKYLEHASQYLEVDTIGT